MNLSILEGFKIEEKKTVSEKKEPEPVAPKPSLGISLTSKSEQKLTVIAGTHSKIEIDVKNNNPDSEEVLLKISLNYSSLTGDECPDWKVSFMIQPKDEKSEKKDRKPKETKFKDIHGLEYLEKLNLAGLGEMNVSILAVTPAGIRYGDKLDVIVNATLSRDPMHTQTVIYSLIAYHAIIAVKTALGHEQEVANAIYGKARGIAGKVFSVFAPQQLRGYLFVEGMSQEAVSELVKGIPKARGIVKGETSFTEIEKFLVPVTMVTGLHEGDMVEVVTGPFKGEKARVRKIDEQKDEITVELIEAVVSIPVTVKGESIRLMEKKEKQKK